MHAHTARAVHPPHRPCHRPDPERADGIHKVQFGGQELGQIAGLHFEALPAQSRAALLIRDGAGG